MAELILTKEEKEAATWVELNDESLGKVVKATMAGIKQTSDEQGKLFYLAAAMILCTVTAEANADTASFTVEGLKNKTNDFGNWKVTIRKMK